MAFEGAPAVTRVFVQPAPAANFINRSSRASADQNRMSLASGRGFQKSSLVVCS